MSCSPTFQVQVNRAALAAIRWRRKMGVRSCRVEEPTNRNGGAAAKKE